ncbi:MAG: nifB [Lachnospiraceae bacterium]|nr:nifB [Lachnospiraceae bacterium]
MKGNIVNLNVNPCKMCMPMGSVTAFYGIKKCMTILHGSQGCSTYIRRHMATHYNEPVDIASSSLTEEGTVYGGEENLIKGLNNLIKVYQPEVIGVSTTCLAETIGEDVPRIIEKFYHTYPEYKDIMIIPVATAGYAGTQFEGFMKTLYQIVKSVSMDTDKHEKVNIVTSTLSPADTRYLKDMLELFSIDYILLPDLSENLDGVYKTNYDRLPSGGTDLTDIKHMAGSRFTIEISSFTNDNPSVAEYLYETYGVPYKKIPLPVSLRDIDLFLDILSELSGNTMSEKLKKERGRFLDAMIDGHKYNGEARAIIYGEPDFVYSTVRLCVENGIMPLITATGSKCSGLKNMLEDEIKEVADRYFIDRYEILNDVDFQTMEEKARELGVNILIGNSDGRRMAENLGVSLVRRSFPIHDRVGGQRLRTLGYEGALTFLDEIANVILGKKETGFREELYHKYYKSDGSESQNDTVEDSDQGINIKSKDAGQLIEKEEEFSMNDNKVNQVMEKTIEEKTATHPCYTCGAHDYARMHLPVAPKCNISCNYCVRKFDCPNESRPGVTTKVLSPEEAFDKYIEVKEKVPNLSVIGIAGPGDALANFENTKKTLELIREHDKNITFCLSTNGLMLPQYARDLIDLGVSHVTVTMNAIDPKIGAKIYREVNYMGERYFGEEAATILLTNQLAGISMLTSKGIMCKVNIVMLQGINDEHIPAVVQKAKDLGVNITNIMQMIPVQGSVFENLPLVSNQEVMKMRKKCGETMKQMYHCKQCRADAIGTLDHDRSIEFNSDSKNKIQIAVATKSGMVVDQHFGQVSELYVYEYNNGSAVFKERRPIKKYCSGTEDCDNSEDKITGIINTISDCDAVIVMRIGEAPKMKLTQKGIKVFTTYDRIEDSVKKAASELAEA